LPNRLKMLWINLTVSREQPLLPIGIEEYFYISRCSTPDRLERKIAEVNPDVLCFDYDYPDQASLQLAREVKKSYWSLPMLMVTLQHSEKLAVWAFRSRLSDYLVKPVPQSELERCHAMLVEMCRAKSGQSDRRANYVEAPLPMDVASSAKGEEDAFLPAIYYVTQNYNRKIQNNEVANLCAMSPFRFSRGFKDAFGISFRDYVVRYRLRVACSMFKNPNVSVTDVSFAVGFNDPAYFSRMFKRHFGEPPSEKRVDDISATAQLRIPPELIREH